MIQGYVLLTNQKNSNYSVTLVRNSDVPKYNVILTSSKFIISKKQGISLL